jgi:hypothetical protein
MNGPSIWRDTRHVRPRFRDFVGISVATALALPLASGPVAAADPQTVKAEMVVNIAKFVRWPDQVNIKNQGQLVFSILGEDDLAAALAGVLSTKTINGREVFVRFIRRPQDARGSQMLFVSANEMTRLPEVLAALEGSSCLTVADAEGFIAQGGMIDFTRGTDHARFEINLGRAERAGLKVSAKLLAVARIID